jgi:hypothetical protein
MTNVTSHNSGVCGHGYSSIGQNPVRSSDCEQKGTVGQSFHIVSDSLIEYQHPAIREIERPVPCRHRMMSADCLHGYPARVLMEFNPFVYFQ